MKEIHLALLNLVLCAGIFWACICRLNTEHAKLHRYVRAKYTILLAGAVLHGLQPTLLKSWPSIADVWFSAVVLAFLALNMRRWVKPHVNI